MGTWGTGNMCLEMEKDYIRCLLLTRCGPCSTCRHLEDEYGNMGTGNMCHETEKDYIRCLLLTRCGPCSTCRQLEDESIVHPLSSEYVS